MTEQEQIEEMVAVMAASNDQFVDVPIEIMPQVAKALYNEGYRKVLLDTEDGKAIDCIQYAPWQLIEGYTEREVKKARKETAEKILNSFAKIMLESYGHEPPCNFNCNDDYMYENCSDYCEKNCNSPDIKQCWKEFLKAKLKELRNK